MNELNITSDSDDCNDENWFGSSTTSADNSSISSIPWAEDVVNQNKDEWDSIERMFYGEEDLPNDDKLKTEILEWTQKFPHLRVIGQQASIFYNVNGIQSDHNYEEIIAIHPPRANQYFSSTSACPKIETINNLEQDMQKCLRITSGPMLLRPNEQNSVRLLARKNHPQINNSAILNSFRNTYGNRNMGRNQDGNNKLDIFPQSARLLKVASTSSQLSAPIGKIFRISTASMMPRNRPLRNSVTLPSISLEPIAREGNVNRSISALISTIPGSRVPSKNALKKRSDSE